MSTTTPESGEIDIDKLLSTPAQEDKQSAEDAEVLRLLGIVPETTKPEPAKPEPTAVVPVKPETAQPSVTDLQKENERLQRELNAREQQLRNTLIERDELLKRLQDAEKAPGRLQTVRTAGAYAGADGYVQRYDEALNLYKQRRYHDAIAAFQALLAESDKSSYADYADNCQYWIGECYYGLGKFQQAIAEFEKVFTFVRSNKSDAALFMLGRCYERMGEREQARSEFEQLIAKYPSSPYVATARKYLARL
ncbi:MAG: tetratricopeptide repeat protein [candidate division KSB1 bacterium]|nr:tetratricopeptide repeat protein [candidate division KSB1 bacterium]MDZ7303567.1 tetratricopeptide repeat protein [candidate division KSB1 bacterium]MDZ7312810.1 tetratricopeptide repeat protein [candidate division KSB1 bacterium]